VPPLKPARAAELFTARALEVAPDVGPTEQEVVLEICERLDCLPLAIELAAARTRVIPPRSLLARLDHAFTVLVDGARDLPERQRTLRLTVAWSHELLGPGEQAMFRHLSVFSGGWTLEAAAAVSQVDEVSTVHLDSALLDGSLIVRRVPPGEPRYGMLRGRIALQRGDRDAACELLRESIAILGRLQDRWAMRPALTHLGDVAAARLDLELAAILYGVADGLEEPSGPSIFPIDLQLSAPYRAVVTTKLGPEQVLAEGRALALEEVVRLAAGR
jgi:hypothetical protein